MRPAGTSVACETEKMLQRPVACEAETMLQRPVAMSTPLSTPLKRARVDSSLDASNMTGDDSTYVPETSAALEDSGR